MIILRIILGIMAIAAGMSCIMYPAIGTATLCMMIAALMLLFGIFAIIRYIEDKNREKVAKKAGIQYFGAGIGSLIFGIAAVIMAIKAMNSPVAAAVLFKVVSVIFGLYIVLHGVTNIMFAKGIKRTGASGWLVIALFGVLTVLLGLFCIFNIFTSAVAMSTLIGLNIMVFGFSLLLGRDF